MQRSLEPSYNQMHAEYARGLPRQRMLLGISLLLDATRRVS